MQLIVGELQFDLHSSDFNKRDDTVTSSALLQLEDF